MSALVWSDILGLFVNTLTAHYLKNKRPFVDFLLHFWNMHEISNILKKEMSILA